MGKYKAYHTLVVREGGIWGPQFGDYDRAVVEQERKDSYRDYKRADWRIITTGDVQAFIDAAVRDLNMEAMP